MKIARSMLLVGLGVGATIAYQKYSKPVKHKVESFVNKTTKRINQDLDEMM